MPPRKSKDSKKRKNPFNIENSTAATTSSGQTKIHDSNNVVGSGTLSTSNNDTTIVTPSTSITHHTHNNNNSTSSNPLLQPDLFQQMIKQQQLQQQQALSRVATQTKSIQQQELDGPPELDPSEIIFDKEKDFIGKGVFGSVYKGTCRGQVVAVKVPLSQGSLTTEQLKEFRQEVAMLRKIYHPNVVLFLGACTQNNNIMIVSQYMPKGNLDQLIKSPNSKSLSHNQKLHMAKDISLGLSWLHNISKIVHRDLKPANLLLSANMSVKLTDFGFAQLRQLEHKRETQPRGSVFWMSPELLTGRPFNEKVDIFSYGIVLWQLITLRPLYDNKYTDANEFARAVCVRQERPSILPNDCSPLLADLMRQCWAAAPANRCTAEHIVETLDTVFIADNVAITSNSLTTSSSSITASTTNALGYSNDPGLLTDSDSATTPLTNNIALLDSETAAARSFWRDCCRVDNSQSLPASCAASHLVLCLRKRLPSNAIHLIEPLIRPLFAAYPSRRVLYGADPGEAAPHADAALSDLVIPIERYTRLLCCIGPWLPLSDDDAGAVSMDERHDVAVAIGTLKWANELISRPWFHGGVGKKLAERRLAGRPERTFLVRMSGTMSDYPFTISLMKNTAPPNQPPQLTVQHKRVQRIWSRGQPDESQWCCQVDGETVRFESVFELIECSAMQLLHPCDRAEIEAAYDIR